MKILFIDGTAGFSPTRLAERPCGGIITSLTLIPRFLASQGHDVTVMSMHETAETVDGVLYFNIKRSIDHLRPDVVVFNRNSIERPIAQFFKDRGARIVWWLHDIVDHRYLPDDGFKLADTIVALSRYCQDSYADFYDIEPERFTLIPNGVDKDIFYPGTEVRDKNLWLYASAPIKGMYPLAFTLGQLKRHAPDLELRMFADQKLHDLQNTKAIEENLDALRAAGAVILPPVPQRQLANLFRKAYALVMPNSYPEICSNVLLQARACGLPVIASDIGSASEFIHHGHSGLLTHTLPHDLFWFFKNYAELCVELLKGDELHAYMSKTAPEGIDSWGQIGAKWNAMIEEKSLVGA